MDHFTEFANIFASLAPYRKELMEEAWEVGLPVIRHPFIHYPSDPVFWNMSSEQFMLGEDIMIAPVLDKGKSHVDIYLPAGEWVHAFTGHTFSSSGESIRLEAPIGTPAVLIKADSKVLQYFNFSITK